MAYITEIDCKECGETKREVTDHSGVCASCRAALADKKRRVALASLKGLTVEERLELIEAELYDLDLASRIGSLEEEHTRYA